MSVPPVKQKCFDNQRIGEFAGWRCFTRCCNVLYAAVGALNKLMNLYVMVWFLCIIIFLPIRMVFHTLILFQMSYQKASDKQGYTIYVHFNMIGSFCKCRFCICFGLVIHLYSIYIERFGICTCINTVNDI